jgi:hypothetical protein
MAFSKGNLKEASFLGKPSSIFNLAINMLVNSLKIRKTVKAAIAMLMATHTLVRSGITCLTVKARIPMPMAAHIPETLSRV